MQMLQTMLEYSEVHTNMRFENIPTMPLELRAGIEKGITSQGDNDNIKDEDNPMDGFNYGCAVDKSRKLKKTYRSINK